MLTPAHPLRSRFTPLWHYRRQLRRARLCAWLTGAALAGMATLLHGYAPRALWQSEGREGAFIGIPYMAEAAPNETAPAARKAISLPSPPPSTLPTLLTAAEWPEAEPLREQELVKAVAEETEPFALEAEETVSPPPPPRLAPARPRTVAAAAEASLTPPAYRETPKPPYPPSLRARRISGSVGVRIAVSAEGVPTEVTVTTPDAHAEFVRTVRRWILEHWRFTPARRGDVPVTSTVQTRVDFVLD